jgi:hypothetical protein
VSLPDFGRYIEKFGLGSVQKIYYEKPALEGPGVGGTLGTPHPRALSYTKHPAFCEGNNIVVNVVPCIYIKTFNTSE